MMKKLAFILIPSILLAGCEGSGMGDFWSNNQRGAIGSVAGAVAGGVLGHQLDSRKGRYVGAVAGALAGAAIGNYMDRQQQQLQRQMANTGVNVSRVDEGTLQLNVPGDLLFATDKYQITPASYGTLNQIAATMNQYPQTIVHVYGHTDSQGADDYNMGLSQRRANAAAQYLVSQGVNPNRIVVQGYGESRPRATNATAAGRQQNRRVEIYIKAINENNPQAAYQPI